MYNLIDYSDNYSDTSGSLWQFKRDESPMNDAENPINVAIDNSSSFKYKSSSDDRLLKNAKVVVPLRYLSNFWQSLETPLINCKIHLELSWEKDCVMYGVDSYDGGDNDNNREITFEITNTKLYVPIATLSTKDN